MMRNTALVLAGVLVALLQTQLNHLGSTVDNVLPRKNYHHTDFGEMERLLDGEFTFLSENPENIEDKWNNFRRRSMEVVK